MMSHVSWGAILGYSNRWYDFSGIVFGQQVGFVLPSSAAQPSSVISVAWA